jgi:flagellar motor switch protein FliG
MLETAEAGIVNHYPQEDVQAALLMQLQQVEEVTGVPPEQLLEELIELQAAAAAAGSGHTGENSEAFSGKASVKALGSQTEEFLVRQVGAIWDKGTGTREGRQW